MSVRVDSIAGMACDYYELLQVEKAKVQQLLAQIQERDSDIAQKDIRILHLESKAAGSGPDQEAAK